MSEFARVHCKIPNGVILRTFEESTGPFGVISHFPKESVTLKGGGNNVNSEFFTEWMKANSDTDLVRNEFIKEI